MPVAPRLEAGVLLQGWERAHVAGSSLHQGSSLWRPLQGCFRPQLPP